MSLARIQEAPDRGLFLLSGVPGSGKSTFCHKVVGNAMVSDKPIIFVTSERSPAQILELFSESGLRQPEGLVFVDAFTETVGLNAPVRSDTVYANCTDLNSLSIAITKLQERVGPEYGKIFYRSMTGKDRKAIRRDVGDYVNLFWPSLAHWSGMLWDPNRFPIMMYELNKQDAERSMIFMKRFSPLPQRMLFRFWGFFQTIGLLPKNLSRVDDVLRLWRKFHKVRQSEQSGIVEYLPDQSKTDEHHYRVYEDADCWAFDSIGTTLASHLPAEIAGSFKTFEGSSRDWNAIETKCIGLGDPYCEFKIVAGEIEGLSDSLVKPSSVIQRIHDRLMDRLTDHLLQGKPLAARPRLGSEIHLHPVMHAFGFPNQAGARYRMALRMGGARSGKEIGKRLVEAGLDGEEAVKRILDFLAYCKVGRISRDRTIRIGENCESLVAKHMTQTVVREPCCFFTTGFLNGIFSAVANQHVREIKCIGVGDAYCEWEIDG